MSLQAIQFATRIAFMFHGTPYIWGGKKPLIGLDCSGFVQSVLVATDAMPARPIMSSGMQWGFFLNRLTDIPIEGCLVFYGKPERINHVMYCLNPHFCIGAAGGNRSCLTVQKAAMIDARVKVLPIRYRKDIVGYVNPFIEV